ncbi:hypothetical protein NPIL_3231 [Nephila pilipes]|uniref:Uncharacterized protein n=1 Tax=Nephila pilipes TaxID=299642 RepID=A0A8X6QHQ6_NEPPI|nr:hypothetical protein NPIL_3231 [Nephila pilipes]
MKSIANAIQAQPHTKEQTCVPTLSKRRDQTDQKQKKKLPNESITPVQSIQRVSETDLINRVSSPQPFSSDNRNDHLLFLEHPAFFVDTSSVMATQCLMLI